MPSGQDARVEVALRRVGVGRSVWGHTLPKLGQDALRAYVVSMDYATGIAYVYAAEHKPLVVQAYLTVIETLAKELVLSKASVFLCDYAELEALLTRDVELLSTTLDQLRDASVIVVRDFVDAARTPRQDTMAFVVSWLMRAHSQGVGLVLGGDTSLEKVHAGFYAGSLLRLMRETIKFPVVK